MDYQSKETAGNLDEEFGGESRKEFAIKTYLTVFGMLLITIGYVWYYTNGHFGSAGVPPARSSQPSQVAA